MGKYRKYGLRVSEMAAGVFDRYNKAQEAMRMAQKKKSEYQHDGSARSLVKKAALDVEVEETEKTFHEAEVELRKSVEDLGEIREELVQALEDDVSADPASLDNNVLELLKSGILTAGEYERLLDEAVGAGNHTMRRIIQKYGKEAAEAVEKRYGADSEAARAFLPVLRSTDDGTEETLAAFDVLSEVYTRTVDNPAMMSKWSELTGEAVELL